REQGQTLFGGRGVPAVVKVDEQDVEFFGGKLFHHSFRRGDRIDPIPLSFQQQAKRFSDIGLIVCDENSRDDRSADRCSLACLHAANGHYSSESSTSIATPACLLLQLLPYAVARVRCRFLHLRC